MDYMIEINIRPVHQIYTQPLFFLMVLQLLVGQGLLIKEASPTHTNTSHSVGLLWTSDQPNAESTHSNRKRQTSMPPAGFEPAIPASEGPQTLDLDGSVTIRNHLVICHSVTNQNWSPTVQLPSQLPECVRSNDWLTDWFYLRYVYVETDTSAYTYNYTPTS